MLSLQIIGLDAVKKAVRSIEKQANYATFRAINRTALAVQEHEITKELPDKLTLRTKWWKPRYKFGVNINFATKTKLSATVDSRAPWLAAVDVGGTKRPQQGKTIAIPTDAINQKEKRRTRNQPTILIASKRAFSITVNGRGGIFRRVGKGTRRLEALYFYYQNPKIPDITDFYESGQRVVDRVYSGFFEEEFTKAKATAR